MNNPAFPQVWHPEMGVSPEGTPPGLTKREYFAAQAMAGYVLHWRVDIELYGECAEHAVAFADALIAELEKARTVKTEGGK